MADVAVLFDEYAAAYARGERPRLDGYLARAGAGAEELARLVEAFLQAAPAPAAAPADVATLDAFLAGDPPLLALRTARGVTRDAVVDAILAALALAPALRAKVRRRYHDLEAGLLDPERVDRRVVAAIAEAVGARAADLFAWTPRPPAAAARAYLRIAEAPAAAAPPAAAPEPPDEVDELFGIRSA